MGVCGSPASHSDPYLLTLGDRLLRQPCSLRSPAEAAGLRPTDHVLVRYGVGGAAAGSASSARGIFHAV
jgi:hypothetical protein